MTKIVLDCYGGDNAPEEIVKGALDALDNDTDLSLVLTGKEDVLKTLVTRNSDRIEIIDAQDVVTNDDVPTDAIRKKTESSMVKAFDALKNRDDIGGILSAGRVAYRRVSENRKNQRDIPSRNGGVAPDGRRQ